MFQGSGKAAVDWLFVSEQQQKENNSYFSLFKENINFHDKTVHLIPHRIPHVVIIGDLIQYSFSSYSQAIGPLFIGLNRTNLSFLHQPLRVVLRTKIRKGQD